MCFVLLSIFMLYMTSGIMSSAISVSISQLIMQFGLLDPFREVTHSKSFAQTKFSVAVLDKKTLS